MFTDAIHNVPAAYAAIESAGHAIAFSMPSDLQTGALLQTLVAAKPGARVLEIGTGTGLATAWLLAGMDDASTLLSIDNSPDFQAVANENLGHDARLTLLCTNAGNWLETNTNAQFDLIFADAWPGKYANLDAALNSLAKGGLYVIDDMLAQPNWPAGHEANVTKLVAELESRADIHLVKMAWSTGIMLVTKK